MNSVKYQYINDVAMKKIADILEEFYQSEQSAEELIEQLKKAFPVHYADENAWKRRLEGFYETSERLLEETIEEGKDRYGKNWNRERAMEEARIQPLKYYHRITGTSDPDSDNTFQRDYFAHFTKALVKLEDDIYLLAKMYRDLTRQSEHEE